MLFPEPSERLRYREWIEEDLEPFIRMNQDKSVMEFFPSTLSKEKTLELVDRISKHFDNFGFGLYAVEKKGDPGFIGFTGFATASFDSFFTPCTEIGWRFDKFEWGKGFAHEAAMACLKFGFLQLGFEKIYSFTSLLNLRSESVMIHLGMKRVGSFEHPLLPAGNPLRTHVLYQLEKSDWNHEHILNNGK
jgi:[ribosomal protein S5]-alanine N-acetyltransferase